MAFLESITLHLSAIAQPLIVFGVMLVIGLVMRKLIIARMMRWARATATGMVDIIIQSIRRPSLIWCVMLALYLALEISTFQAQAIALSERALFILGVISVTLVLANMLSGMIKTYSARIGSGLPITSLTQNVSRLIIFGIGILIVLHSIGISITPILATLGVGGLAVALALQDTLTNLFAGFHVIVGRQIKIGDYIKLESGQEGYVTDIDWRITKIKTPSHNVILVPNAKLAQTIVINYHLPAKELSFSFDLGIHYDSDLEKVERIVKEVGRDVMKNARGGVAGFEPDARFSNFGDSSIMLGVSLRAQEFSDQSLVKHEFIKRLHARFKKEGIVIPYPVRAINYAQEKAVG